LSKRHLRAGSSVGGKVVLPAGAQGAGEVAAMTRIDLHIDCDALALGLKKAAAQVQAFIEAAEAVHWRFVNPHSILRDFDKWFEFECVAHGLKKRPRQ
jgi:hypothetical protein